MTKINTPYLVAYNGREYCSVCHGDLIVDWGGEELEKASPRLYCKKCDCTVLDKRVEEAQAKWPKATKEKI